MVDYDFKEVRDRESIASTNPELIDSDGDNVNMSDLEFMGGSSDDDTHDCDDSDMFDDNSNDKLNWFEPNEFMSDSEDTYEKYLESKDDVQDYPQKDTIDYDNLPDPPCVENLDTREFIHQEQMGHRQSSEQFPA